MLEYLSFVGSYLALAYVQPLLLLRRMKGGGGKSGNVKGREKQTKHTSSESDEISLEDTCKKNACVLIFNSDCMSVLTSFI